jgi:1-pyrroline-4-hydroxy-2-carboxylate deaminase
VNWSGVLPAMTTPFDSEMKVDHAFLAQHARWQIGNGVKGLVMLGSLGEGATLEHAEKIAILKTAVDAAGELPVVASISALSTEVAVRIAREAEGVGCQGLMVLPPYVYTSDWYEMKEHVSAVIKSTKLDCMLYNNPVAYKTDFLPSQIAELAEEHENLKAVKESSTDARRVAWIRSEVGERIRIFMGVDDAIVEGCALGAVGWVAGLVNAFPAESVALFDLAREGKFDEAFALYSWFLPLLRMDTVPKFVQLIKWVQGEMGVGSARVRAPRLEITGAELDEARAVLKKALAARPGVTERPFAQFA